MSNYIVRKYRCDYVAEDNNLTSYKISNKIDVTDFCKTIIKDSPIELFLILALNNSNTVIGYQLIEGDTNQCVVYPKKVFSFLLSSVATSFVICHNHPGGSINFSQQDINLTKKLYSIGKELELPLIDHVLITDNNFISYKFEIKF